MKLGAGIMGRYTRDVVRGWVVTQRAGLGAVTQGGSGAWGSDAGGRGLGQ